MHLTDQVVISHVNANYYTFKYLCGLSAKIFNHFNNIISANYIEHNTVIPYPILDKLIKHCNNLNIDNIQLIQSLKHNQINFLSFDENNIQLNKINGFSNDDYNIYSLLPAKTTQNILKQLIEAWNSYNTKLSNYNKALIKQNNEPNKKHKKLHKPNPPSNKSNNDLNIIELTNQQFEIANISINKVNNIIPNFINKHDLTFNPVRFNVMNNNIKVNEIRIIPKYKSFIFEVVYTFNPPQSILNTEQSVNTDLLKGYYRKTNQTTTADLNPYKYASIDLGINNLCAITNNFDNNYRLISGKLIKSINLHTNKLISNSKKKKHPLKLSNRIKHKLWTKRTSQITHYFHLVSNYIINYCLDNGIKNLIIGYNKGWKDKVKLGRKINQQFVSIPYCKIKTMLSYKCEIANIKFIPVNEWYTSACSFIDYEKISKKKDGDYKGYRPNKGKYYYTKSGYKIHADINASLNILRIGILYDNKYNKKINDEDKDKVWWFDYKQRLTYLECILTNNQPINKLNSVDYVKVDTNGQGVNNSTIEFKTLTYSSHRKNMLIKDVIVCPIKVKFNIF